MPRNKSAHIRYRIIDTCLRSRTKRYPGKKDLIEACSGLGSVSIRTIEQDLYDMQYDEELGYLAPIRYDAKQRGYYYTDPAYSINKIPLKQEDLYALEFACSLLRQFEGIGPVRQFIMSVGKIEEYVNMRTLSGEDDLSGIVQTEQGLSAGGNEYLAPLLTAIRERTIMMLHYRRFGKAETKVYTFHPYVLKEYHNRWYVTGWSAGNSRIRTFALERIAALLQSDAHFDPQPGFNPQDYFKYSFGISVFEQYQPEIIELSFTPTQAPFVKSQPWHETQQVLRDDEKEFRIKIEVIPSYELKAQILSYGNQVRVLKPESLKKEVAETLRLAAENYGVIN